MTTSVVLLSHEELFQLTSSRRGWRAIELTWDAVRNISTHILTKRMTPSGSNTLMHSSFQLTSSRRGWQKCLLKSMAVKYFNSHPHEEDDGNPKKNRKEKRRISTHILTKRMTSGYQGLNPTVSFQLTSSRRGWRQSVTTPDNSSIFQLTSSRRGWHLPCEIRLQPSIFQLTSSRRGWPTQR